VVRRDLILLLSLGLLVGSTSEQDAERLVSITGGPDSHRLSTTRALFFIETLAEEH